MNTSSALQYHSPGEYKQHCSHITKGDYYLLSDCEQDIQTKDLMVTRGGLECCDSDYRVDRKRVRFYAIEYILSGTCRLTLQGKVYNLSSGSVFCYGPHIDHKIENSGDTPLIKHFIDFAGTSVPDILWEAFLKDDTPCKLNNVKWLSDTFQQILDCGRLGDPHAQGLCTTLLKYIIKRVEADKITNPRTLSPAQGSYQRTRNFIEQNYLDIRRMSEVAKACHLSLPHLCRLFKRFSKESPTQLLIRLKLEKAVEMLSEGDFLIKEIADHVGFEDPFYFSYRFKQHFGVSPSSFVSTVNPAQTKQLVSQVC